MREGAGGFWRVGEGFEGWRRVLEGAGEYGRVRESPKVMNANFMVINF